MSKWQIVLLSILIGCGCGGVMAVTNPDRSAYENFAVDRIGELAKDKCAHAPDGLGVLIQEPCQAAIAAYQPELRLILASATSRQNWVLFSIYRSKMIVPIVNLPVQVESIGIFDRFFVYKTP
jgi:Domain of unknown function (DUF4359)